MTLPFNIIAIDLETTDSNPTSGSIIQLSAVALNKEFELVKSREFNLYVQPLDTYRNPKAMAVNKISEETLKTGYTLVDTLELFESYWEKGEILASWANYFDIPFLRKQYEKLERKWPFSYKSIDLKSIAIFEMAKRNQDASGGVQRFLKNLDMPFEGTPHSALDDIKNSVKIIQILTKVE